jgi:hypothetical protein
MEHILKAAFGCPSEAEHVRHELIAKGVAGRHISVSTPQNEAAGSSIGSLGERISHFFCSLFDLADDEPPREAITHHSTVLTVTLTEHQQQAVVEAVLAQNGAMNFHALTGDYAISSHYPCSTCTLGMGSFALASRVPQEATGSRFVPTQAEEEAWLNKPPLELPSLSLSFAKP